MRQGIGHYGGSPRGRPRAHAPPLCYAMAGPNVQLTITARDLASGPIETVKAGLASLSGRAASTVKSASDAVRGPAVLARQAARDLASQDAAIGRVQTRARATAADLRGFSGAARAADAGAGPLDATASRLSLVQRAALAAAAGVRSLGDAVRGTPATPAPAPVQTLAARSTPRAPSPVALPAPPVVPAVPVRPAVQRITVSADARPISELAEAQRGLLAATNGANGSLRDERGRFTALRQGADDATAGIQRLNAATRAMPRAVPATPTASPAPVAAPQVAPPAERSAPVPRTRDDRGRFRAATGEAQQSAVSLRVASDTAHKSVEELGARALTLRQRIAESSRAFATKTGTLRIYDGALRGARSEMSSLASAARGLGGRVKETDGQLGAGAAGAKRLTGSLGSAGGAADLLKVGMRALAGSVAVHEYVKLSDTWTNITSKLSLVTTGSEQLTQVQGQLFDVAQRTRQPLESTADLYSRMATNAASLNLTSKDLVGLTETIGQTMTISGASAASASASLTQLGQALGSGTLRGDELNSILEQSPRLAKAIAAGMGVAIGDLKKLGEAGALTSKMVVDAIRSQSGVIAAEHAKMGKTVSQGWTQVQNALLRAVGSFDKAIGVSGALGGAMGGLGDIIDLVSRTLGENKDVVGEWGKAFGAWMTWAKNMIVALARSAVTGFQVVRTALQAIGNGINTAGALVDSITSGNLDGVRAGWAKLKTDLAGGMESVAVAAVKGEQAWDRVSAAGQKAVAATSRAMNATSARMDESGVQAGKRIVAARKKAAQDAATAQQTEQAAIAAAPATRAEQEKRAKEIMAGAASKKKPKAHKGRKAKEEEHWWDDLPAAARETAAELSFELTKIEGLLEQSRLRSADGAVDPALAQQADVLRSRFVALGTSLDPRSIGVVPFKEAMSQIGQSVDGLGRTVDDAREQSIKPLENAVGDLGSAFDAARARAEAAGTDTVVFPAGAAEKIAQVRTQLLSTLATLERGPKTEKTRAQIQTVTGLLRDTTDQARALREELERPINQGRVQLQVARDWERSRVPGTDTGREGDNRAALQAQIDAERATMGRLHPQTDPEDRQAFSDHASAIEDYQAELEEKTRRYGTFLENVNLLRRQSQEEERRTSFGANLASSLVENMRRAGDSMAGAFGKAFSSVRSFSGAFKAAGAGAKAFATEMKNAVLGSIGAMAINKGKFYLAEAVAAGASGFMGNPGGFAAAAKYAGAAALMFALGGALSGGGGGGGGGGGAQAQQNARTLTNAEPATANVIIKGGFINTSDGRAMRDLNAAVEANKGKRILIMGDG